MSESVNIAISDGLIRPIIESKIKTALINALGDEKSIIENMIDFYLSQKVDVNGKISNYSSDNKHTRIDILLNKLVEEAIKDAIIEWIADKQSEIKSSLKKYFQTGKGQKAMTESFADGLLASLGGKYSFSVTLKKYQE